MDCTKWPHNPFAAPEETETLPLPDGGSRKPRKGDLVDFPTARLRRCGATDEEIQHLQEAHDDSNETAKASLLERLASIADQDIRDWLERLREHGYLGEIQNDATTSETEGDEDTGPEDELDSLTKQELLERAEAAGVNVPAKATKADIAELLTSETEGDEDTGPEDEAPAEDASTGPE